MDSISGLGERGGASSNVRREENEGDEEGIAPSQSRDGIRVSSTSAPGRARSGCHGEGDEDGNSGWVSSTTKGRDDERREGEEGDGDSASEWAPSSSSSSKSRKSRSRLRNSSSSASRDGRKERRMEGDEGDRTVLSEKWSLSSSSSASWRSM